jgi:hypothetical protein
MYAACPLRGAQVQDYNAPASVSKEPRVTLKLGTMKITNTMIELRCEVANNSQQDVWVYEEGVDLNSSNSARGANARLLVGSDRQTLLILRRMLFLNEWC